MSTCKDCGKPVDPSDDFCPHCGTLCLQGATCRNHAGKEATGVCVICAEPYCAACGGRVGRLFLCGAHDRYEILEGMARVYGGSDAVQIEFAKSCLSDAGLHPFVFSRKTSPISLGGPDYTLFRASGDYEGHIVNEFKLMVPCAEVLEAERTLTELGIRS
jgi:hypothetical protein